MLIRDCGVLITPCVSAYSFTLHGTAIKFPERDYQFNYHLSGAHDPSYFADKKRCLIALARALADECAFFGIRKLCNIWLHQAASIPEKLHNSHFFSGLLYKKAWHDCSASPFYKCAKCNVITTYSVDLLNHMNEIHGFSFFKEETMNNFNISTNFW